MKKSGFVLLAWLTVSAAHAQPLSIEPRVYIGSSGIVSGPVKCTDGTAVAPCYTFKDDTSLNVGLYRIGEDNVGFSAGGVLRWDYNTTRLLSTIAFQLPNTGLQVYDTDASHFLSIVPGSNLTVGRTLTVTTGDAARTVTLDGNPTLNDWFDQSVKAAASPTFVTPLITSVEVGHATDTTLSRASAGVLAVEGSNLIRAADLGTGVLTWLGTPSSANFATAVTGETGTGAIVFGTAPSFTTSYTLTADSLVTTSTDGNVIQNTTAATVGVAVQISPRTRWSGTAWDTDDAVSRTARFIVESLPVSGAAVTGTWKLGWLDPVTSVITYPLIVTDAGVVTTLSNIELGHATDTTLSRGSAGVVAVEGSSLARAADNLSFFAATTSLQLLGVISDETGSGLAVFATSPTLTTPNIGVATATTVNKVTITAPLTGSTLTVADGKTLTASNTLTFTGTDTSSVAFGTGGTATYTANNLSVFAATTSTQLAGVISDETGSGLVVLATSPALVTPTLGVATATTINKVALTAPATSATLTVADGKTLTASNTLTFTGTDASSVAFSAGGTVAYTSNNLSVFAATTSAQLAGVTSDETGTGVLVLGTSPTFTTGITSPVFNATGTIADAGTVRLANATNVAWRNAANTDNYTFGLNASNQFVLGPAGATGGVTLATPVVGGDSNDITIQPGAPTGGGTEGDINLRASDTGPSAVRPGGVITLRAGDAAGTDRAGSNITISAGPATGNAASGAVIFQTSTAGATGTAVQALAERWRIDSSGLKLGTGAVLLISQTAPTISSGFGTTPSIASSNGTATFRVNVGTGGTATSGIVTMPTATNGWNCTAFDETTLNVNTRVSAQTTTSITISTTVAWAASDILVVQCKGF